MPAGIVKVGVEAKLSGIAFGEKILTIEIKDDDPLITRVELVQIGVGVFLAHIEKDKIVLPPIVIVVAE